MSGHDDSEDGVLTEAVPSLEDTVKGVGDVVGGGQDPASVASDLLEGGVVRATVGAIKRANPTGTENLQRAIQAEVQDTVLRVVPEHESRLARLEAKVVEVFEDRARTLRSPLHDEVVRLVAEGSLGPEDIQSEGNIGIALFNAYRSMLDAVDPAAGPPLARLSLRYRTRPLDRLFRGACRVLTDLAGDEIAALTTVIAAGASHLAANVLVPPELPEGATDQQRAVWSESVRLRFYQKKAVLYRSHEDRREACWHDGAALPLDPDGHVVRLLVSHELAARIDKTTRLPEEHDPWEPLIVPMSPQELLAFPIETVLELHFALSNERIVDRRGEWEWAEQLRAERRGDKG